jgi:hypothetical protein
MRFHLQDRTKLHVIFGVGCAVVLVLSFFLSAKESLPVTITLLTAVGGVTGFLYAKHAQETQVFRELFCEFNARYDKLNGRLNEIRNRPAGKPIEDADHGVLFDYFNLCAEEYLYASAGYIDPRVWRAWQNGMCYFDEDPEIHDFWKRELQQDSYYGFTLDCIRNA